MGEEPGEKGVVTIDWGRRLPILRRRMQRGTEREDFTGKGQESPSVAGKQYRNAL